ncbi:MAG: homoserine dehydrogenase [Brevinematales bacterium]|nr:homoserine dehydrogenase [Brevinematales bacterium]
MKKVAVGVVGFGTVGGGVVDILQKNRDLIKSRTGIDIELKYVASRNFGGSGVEILYSRKTMDYNDIINDKDVDIVVELVGGIDVPYDIITKSIKSGKSVVTANKALLAEKGDEIFSLAKEYGVVVGFEASVAGGIPIIRILGDGLVGDRVSQILGILNGTTNFILTKMFEENMDFPTALKKAQELGFAEADPSLDIDGIDTAHKIAVLARLAFNTRIDFNSVYVEGIRNVSLDDVRYAYEMGFVLKLLGISRLDDDGTIEVRVHPSLVSKTNQLAFVRNEYNAVMIESKHLGVSMYYGKGAGRYPTAVSVVSDIIEIAKNISNPKLVDKIKEFENRDVKPIGDIYSRYYLRFSVIDKPGVLSAISKILGDNNISIASVIQKEVSPHEFVPLVMVTHHSREKDLIRALSEINNLKVVKGQGVMIRIIDEI